MIPRASFDSMKASRISKALPTVWGRLLIRGGVAIDVIVSECEIPFYDAKLTDLIFLVKQNLEQRDGAFLQFFLQSLSGIFILIFPRTMMAGEAGFVRNLRFEKYRLSHNKIHDRPY